MLLPLLLLFCGSGGGSSSSKPYHHRAVIRLDIQRFDMLSFLRKQLYEAILLSLPFTISLFMTPVTLLLELCNIMQKYYTSGYPPLLPLLLVLVSQMQALRNFFDGERRCFFSDAVVGT